MLRQRQSCRNRPWASLYVIAHTGSPSCFDRRPAFRRPTLRWEAGFYLPITRPQPRSNRAFCDFLGTLRLVQLSDCLVLDAFRSQDRVQVADAIAAVERLNASGPRAKATVGQAAVVLLERRQRSCTFELLSQVPLTCTDSWALSQGSGGRSWYLVAPPSLPRPRRNDHWLGASWPD